ncbi:MAG: ATP phosphoribosyltransferase regulatory subunit [Armatimonadetes bacterium]|nr:ATP phosphoribosyltransferase regulatory subunit [Armatimonadota bacterium]
MEDRMLTNYPGTQDRFTDDILLRQWILSKFQEVYRLLGFSLLETPCLEPVEILAKSGGVGDQPTFVFTDKHRDQVCLKPDQTVSLRRVVEQHRLRLPFPRHQVGLSFRQDKPEKGRWREFLQCDADFVGAPLGTADAETALWLLKGFEAVGLPETVLYVNTRAILKGLYASLADATFDELTFTRAVDKVPTNGDLQPVLQYLSGGDEEGKTAVDPARRTAAERVAKLISGLRDFRELACREALAKFAAAYPDLAEEAAQLGALIDCAAEAGAPVDRMVFDPCLARGMDYYTGPVFEAHCPAWPYGSIAGGGRYDNMIKVDDEPQPSVGASFGLDRIEQALKDLGRVPAECTQRIADALVVVKPDWLPGAMRVAKQLRDAGVRTIVYPDPAETFKLQTRYAAKNGIPCAVFFGPDEQAEGKVTVREITPEREVFDKDAARAAKNVTVPLDQLVETVRSLG